MLFNTSYTQPEQLRNPSQSQSQIDDIIYNQLHPSHHHYHLAPFSFSSSSRSWTTAAGLASWVHHLQCASLQITICHNCNNVQCIQRKASSQYDALGATKWWSLVCSFIFCTLVHLGLALILPTMDALCWSHITLWITTSNNDPQTYLFNFSCISCCLYWKMINRIV